MPKRRLSFPQRGLVHLSVLVAFFSFLLVVAIVLAAKTTTTQQFALTSPQVQGVLIAKGGDSGSSAFSESGSDSSGSGSDSADDNDSPSDSSRSGSGDSSNTRVRLEDSHERQRIELRFSQEERIKTRFEPGKTRIDVYSGGVKVRYELKDGKVVIKAKTQEGANVPEQELFKIVERLDKQAIKVSTFGGELVIHRHTVGARANFPLQIDLATNQLIASTAAGPRVLTTLPDQAVQNMLAANVLSRLVPSDLAREAQLRGPTAIADVITLTERNGLPVYEIRGLFDQNLLGFVPLTLVRTVFVSAQTGLPVASEQSLLANIIDFLSP